MKANWGLAGLLAAMLVVAASGSLRADELDALHARILREPGNSELNLRFARLAEERGTLRWALAAYERVLVNDPNNFDAKLGMMRVRRAMQPSFTLVTAELGTGYESNPRYYLPDGKMHGSALVRWAFAMSVILPASAGAPTASSPGRSIPGMAI